MISERYQHRAVLLASGKVLVVGGSGDGSAEVYDPGTGAWTVTGPLNNGGRSVSTLSLLPNGLALVAGGDGNDTAELFNPATGIWTPTGSMATARASHTATVLTDGKVMVAGGIDNDQHVLTSAELYDPAAGTWTTIGSMKTIRTHHTATLLGNGRVLVAGGDDNTGKLYYTSTELFTPSHPTVPDTWTATGSLNFNRSRHSATLLSNGKVLVVGGVNLNGTPIASAELYDISAGTWESTGSLHSPHAGHTATLLNDGKVLITGGIDNNNSGVSIVAAEVYDPSTGVWTQSAPLTLARQNHTATVLPNGAVLVVGGLGTNNFNPLTSTELYDPTSDTWTATTSLNHARSEHTATLLNDGKVLVAGGSDSYNTELYDPATALWTNSGQLILNTFGHTATLLADGKVLLAGGNYVAGPFLMTSQFAYLYDPATATWAATGSMAIGHESHTATRLTDGPVLVAGLGYASGSPNSAELYDPAKGTWATAAALITPRGHHTATLLPGGQVMVVGGYGLTVGNTAELYGVVVPAILLTNPTILADGSFEFGFASAAGSGHTVLATEDLATPFTGWSVLGSATEISPGKFQFTDSEAPNYPRRFYVVSTP
jgi:N-acetylneuraminic acid mutarotase